MMELSGVTSGGSTYSYPEPIAIIRSIERGVFNKDAATFVNTVITVLNALNKPQFVKIINDMQAEIAAGEDPENLYRLAVQITCRVICPGAWWSADHILGYHPPLLHDLMDTRIAGSVGKVLRAANALFIPVLSKRAGEFASRYPVAVVVTDREFDRFSKILPKATSATDSMTGAYAMEIPAHMIVSPKWKDNDGVDTSAVWVNKYPDSTVPTQHWNFTCKKTSTTIDATIKVSNGNGGSNGSGNNGSGNNNNTTKYEIVHKSVYKTSVNTDENKKRMRDRCDGCDGCDGCMDTTSVNTDSVDTDSTIHTDIFRMD